MGMRPRRLVAISMLALGLSGCGESGGDVLFGRISEDVVVESQTLATGAFGFNPTCVVRGTVRNLTDRELLAEPFFLARNAAGAEAGRGYGKVTLAPHQRRPYEAAITRGDIFGDSFALVPCAEIASVELTRLRTCDVEDAPTGICL